MNLFGQINYVFTDFITKSVSVLVCKFTSRFIYWNHLQSQVSKPGPKNTSSPYTVTLEGFVFSYKFLNSEVRRKHV